MSPTYSLLRGVGMTNRKVVGMTADKYVDAIADVLVGELQKYYDRDYIQYDRDTTVNMAFINIVDDTDEANEDMTITVFRDWGRSNGIGIEVYKPISEPYVSEIHDFNWKQVFEIDSKIEKLSKLISEHKLDNWVRLPHGTEFCMDVISDETAPYYDDVGNQWRRERAYLVLKFVKVGMGTYEIEEIAKLISSDFFWGIIQSLLPPEFMETVIEIDNLASGTYPRFED